MDTQLARATVSVREMILRGRLKPGQRVTEIMLAQLLGNAFLSTASFAIQGVAALERFLDYVQKYPQVWICRRVDIARHWMATHPADSPSGIAPEGHLAP